MGSLYGFVYIKYQRYGGTNMSRQVKVSSTTAALIKRAMTSGSEKDSNVLWNRLEAAGLTDTEKSKVIDIVVRNRTE